MKTTVFNYYFKALFIILALMFSSPYVLAEKQITILPGTDQYNKTLVNEWIQLKSINLALEEKGSKVQAELFQILSDKNIEANNRIYSIIKELADEFNTEIKKLNPQTIEIKKLIDLHIKNNDMSLKVLPNHFQLIQSNEENNQNADQHHKEFMQFADATADVKQYENEIEIQIVRYLKDHPLK